MKLTGFHSDSLTPPEYTEAWRFTAMAKSLPSELRPAKGAGSADLVLAGNKFTLGDLPQGVVAKLERRDPGQDFWQQLSGAGDILTLTVNQTPARPLRILVTREASSAEEATLGQVMIQVKAAQKLVIEQTLSGSEQGLSAHQTHIELEKDAVVEHAIVLKDGAEALHLATFDSVLAERAHLSQTFVLTGSRMTRIQLMSTLKGEGAHASLSSITKLAGKSHVDLNSTLRHLSANTTASQLAKNILDDESKAIFTGKVHIAKDSQQVSAEQLNRNLLLSKKAHAIGQPQLEILADDVKCSHGSTTGQIEEDATFYLLSRGIPKERAAALLTRAFVEEVIHQAPEKLRAFLGGAL